MAVATSPETWELLVRRLSRQFSIERVTGDRMQPLCAFFQRAYADQPVAPMFQDLAVIRRHWQWLNDAYPLPYDGGLPAWVCLQGGQIVGHFAALPAVAMVRSRQVPIGWSRDLIVAPEVRLQGVGPFLIMTVARELGRPFFVAGLNEAVLPIYRRLGFHDCGVLPLYVKVAQAQQFLEAFPWPQAARWTVRQALTLARWVADRSKRQARTLTIAPLDAFDAQFDHWWEGIEGAFRCVVRRTSQTMQWRYHDHPEHHYHVLAAKEAGRLRGIVIARRGRSKGLSAGFITELLAHPDDHEVMRELIMSAEEVLQAGQEGAPVFLRSTALHRAFETALARAGFFHVPSPIHWMMTQAKEAPVLEDLVCRRDWFLNAGDADLDLLNP